VSQSNSDVVAIAGADDGDVVERVASTCVLVRPLAVAVYLVGIVEDIGSALVGDPVDRDGDVAGLGRAKGATQTAPRTRSWPKLKIRS